MIELPVKPPHHASHGQTVDRHGTCAFRTTWTGMVVSGAEVRDEIDAGRDELLGDLDGDVESDWEFFTVTSILYFVLPMVIPRTCRRRCS